MREMTYEEMRAIEREKERRIELIKRHAEEQAHRIVRRRRTKLIVSSIVLIAFFTFIWVGAALGPGYTYQKNVHAYMEQAYYSADPVLMQDNINKAKQGMENLGLTPEMYSSFFFWEQTPDKQMLWEYQHLNSIDVRCNEFISWIHAQNDTGSQQMQDVYSQKLNNIREFIRDDGGWSDDIAQSAYMTNFNVFFAVGYAPILAILFVLVTYCGISFIVDASNEYDLAQRLYKKALELEQEEK